jgi:hypothetical protein
MLKSFTSIHPECPVLVCDNSTDNDTQAILTKSNIPFFSNKGGLHGPSVDLLLSKVKTRYVLLVDTDVIFLKNHDAVFEQFCEKNISLMGEIVGDRGGKLLHLRVHPWHCFIDVRNIRDNSINFYDDVRMKSRDSRRYDVGSSFFEDIKKAGLLIANYNGQNYLYKHYEGMSWHVNRFGKDDGDIDVDKNATHNNIGILRYGQMVLEQYNKETAHLNNVILQYNA